MSRIEIVNKSKGSQRESGKVIATAISQEIEQIARREAAKNGFDIEKESNGLMRAILQVLSRKELLAEATRLARKRLEHDGTIARIDSAIVKQPGKFTS